MDEHNDDATVFQVTNDSIFSSEGKLLHISCDNFIQDIVNGACCFVCGRPEGEWEKSTGEHVLPDWLLKHFEWRQSKKRKELAMITLPGKQYRKYGGYRIRCCLECNGLLSKAVEVPISEMLKGGMRTLEVELRTVSGRSLMYQWLCLIFLKTHLFDRERRVIQKDPESPLISTVYDWRTLHHIHAVARAAYSGTLLDPMAVGSIFVVEVKDPFFDYVDVSEGRALYLAFGDFAVFCVLDDGCGVNCFGESITRQVPPPVTRKTARTLLGHLAYVNMRLKERPLLYTDCGTAPFCIRAKLPSRPVLMEHDPELFSKVMDAAHGARGLTSC